MNLNELQKLILEQAEEKKWGCAPDEIIFGEKIALLHAEISEALEAYRKGNITGEHSVCEELGDAIMRILQLAGIYNFDLEKKILEKIEKNKSRDWSNDQLYKDREKYKNIKSDI